MPRRHASGRPIAAKQAPATRNSLRGGGPARTVAHGMEGDSTADLIWSTLHVDRGLAADFLAVFSRFEYSLKRNGYLLEGKAARPDWNCFAARLQGECSPSEAKAVVEAVPYLAVYPTRKQIVEDHSLSWDEPGKPVTTLTGLLDAVRITRNNLFHGGKFPIPVGPVTEPLRDSKLVHDCIAVLLACLELDCPVARALKLTFWDFEARKPTTEAVRRQLNAGR
jgi:hypothetical protein